MPSDNEVRAYYEANQERLRELRLARRGERADFLESPTVEELIDMANKVTREREQINMRIVLNNEKNEVEPLNAHDAAERIQGGATELLMEILRLNDELEEVKAQEADTRIKFENLKAEMQNTIKNASL